MLSRSRRFLGDLPAVAARRLTDAGLAALVRRAHGRLEHLDVGGAELTTDAGLIASLAQPHALTTFRADYACSRLTVAGVTRALAPQRGRLLDLRVAGLDCLPHKPGGEITVTAWNQECFGVIDALRALMAPRGRLIGAQMCSGNDGSDSADDEHCACMCGPDDACQECGVVLCADHATDRFIECDACGECFCIDQCIQGGVCDQCEADGYSDSDQY